MRLFNSNLLTFPVSSLWIHQITLTSNLGALMIHPKAHNNNMSRTKKIREGLSVGLSKMPTYLEFTRTGDNFVVDGLYDILLELDRLEKKLEKTDSLFLEKISNIRDTSEIRTRMIHESPDRISYISLQACRSHQMQHALESPIKALQMHGVLSQHDVNKIMLAVWPIINANRAAYEKEHGPIMVLEPPETPFICS